MYCTFFSSIIRYSATVVSTIVVYCLLWYFLGADQTDITVTEAPIFRDMALISLGMGGFCSLIFHIIVKNNEQHQTLENIGQSMYIPNNEGETASDGRSSNNILNEQTEHDNLLAPLASSGAANEAQMQTCHQVMGIKDWLLEPQLYQVACVYMSARLFVNTTQSYIPLYLQDCLKLKADYVAVIPVIMYATGFCVSIAMKPITRYIGLKYAFAIACAIGISSCLLMNPGNNRINNCAIKLYVVEYVFIISCFLFVTLLSLE